MAKNATAASEDARAAALASFLKTANAKESGAVFTANSDAMEIEAISTGALNLDYALGIGGVPRGRIVELYGPEMSGKTSLALSIGANAVKDGGMMGYVDVENAISFEHVKDMGIDPDYFALSQPNSGEEALQMVEQMARSRLFSVVGLDSVAALVPRAELEGDIGDTHVGLTARLMSQGLRKLAQVANETNTTLIFINQLREKIGVMYGNPETTPGGRALKYYASVRLDVRSPASNQIKVGTGAAQEVIGQRCKVTVKKNKVAAPFKHAEYNLHFGKGIDGDETIIDTAVLTGVWLTKPGGTYLDGITGETIGRGKANIAEKLKAEPEYAAQVREAVLAQMRSKVTATTLDASPMSAQEIAAIEAAAS